MRCCRELFHVSADLGQDAGGGLCLDAWDALEQMERLGKSSVVHAPPDLLIEHLNLLVQELKMTKRMQHEESLSRLCDCIVRPVRAARLNNQARSIP